MSKVEMETLQMLGILKPGDILIVEAQMPMSRELYADMKRMFEDAARDLGIKILMLPHGIKAVRNVMVEKQNEKV